LDAATISMALVILRVFCTLLILVRISLIPGIDCSCRDVAAGLPARYALEGAAAPACRPARAIKL
jgi:hypothetical protein